MSQRRSKKIKKGSRRRNERLFLPAAVLCFSAENCGDGQPGRSPGRRSRPLRPKGEESKPQALIGERSQPPEEIFPKPLHLPPLIIDRLPDTPKLTLRTTDSRQHRVNPRPHLFTFHSSLFTKTTNLRRTAADLLFIVASLRVCRSTFCTSYRCRTDTGRLRRPCRSF